MLGEHWACGLIHLTHEEDQGKRGSADSYGRLRIEPPVLFQGSLFKAHSDFRNLMSCALCNAVRAW